MLNQAYAWLWPAIAALAIEAACNPQMWEPFIRV